MKNNLVGAKKIILFDVDGTIRGHHRTGDVIDSQLLPLLLRLKHEGYVLSIVTGRPYLFYKEYVEELLKDTQLIAADLPFDFIVYENGHRLCINGKHISLLSEQSKQDLNDMRGFLNDRLKEATQPLNFAYAEKRIQGDCMITILDLAKTASSEGLSLCGSTCDYLKNVIAELGLRNLKIHTTSIDHMTIEACDSTKKTAIQKLLNEHKEIVFCCDGKNDIELAEHVLALGGDVVCPANAVDDLKNIATFVSSRKHGAGICDYLMSKLL